MNKNMTEMETATLSDSNQENFKILDIFNYQKVFDLAGIENTDFTFWIWVAVFYIILLIPCWIVIRSILFLILPKKWLRKIFKI